MTGCHILSENQALIVITTALPPGCATLYYMLGAQLFHNPQLTSHTEHSWCTTAALTSKQTSQRTRESHALRVMHAGREPTSHSSVLPCQPQTLWMAINPYTKDIKHLTFSTHHFKIHISVMNGALINLHAMAGLYPPCQPKMTSI